MIGGVTIIMRDIMDIRVTPPKHLTFPTWSSPTPRKQTL